MPFASVVPVESPVRSEPCLAEFITCREAISIDTRVSEIAERFRLEPELEAVGVVNSHGVPVGLLDRTKLLFKLAHQYGHALYARAAVSKVLEGTPRSLPAQTPLSNALSTVLGKEDADLSEAIVVVDDDQNFVGLVSVRRLIMLQANALTNATLEWQLVDQKARELERVAELKSRFLAHVTHELRAPVNAMIGLVDLLLRSSREGDVGSMNELLTLLSASATSLRSLVTNVLDLSKLEAGRVDVVVEEFDLNPIVRDVAAMTRILLGGKAVSVEVIAHDGPTRLCSDPIKVKQILTNLASNAAKFTAAGQVRFELRGDGAGASIGVRDTGVGIAAGEMSTVFEPFVQLGDVQTRSHEGTGLGLTITARLTRLLGGTVQLESEPGAGSLFRITLPHLPLSDASDSE